MPVLVRQDDVEAYNRQVVVETWAMTIGEDYHSIYARPSSYSIYQSSRIYDMERRERRRKQTYKMLATIHNLVGKPTKYKVQEVNKIHNITDRLQATYTQRYKPVFDYTI